MLEKDINSIIARISYYIDSLLNQSVNQVYQNFQNLMILCPYLLTLLAISGRRMLEEFYYA